MCYTIIFSLSCLASRRYFSTFLSRIRPNFVAQKLFPINAIIFNCRVIILCDCQTLISPCAMQYPPKTWRHFIYSKSYHLEIVFTVCGNFIAKMKSYLIVYSFYCDVNTYPAHTSTRVQKFKDIFYRFFLQFFPPKRLK